MRPIFYHAKYPVDFVKYTFEDFTHRHEIMPVDGMQEQADVIHGISCNLHTVIHSTL